jgi:hypothetical protein
VAPGRRDLLPDDQPADDQNDNINSQGQRQPLLNGNDIRRRGAAVSTARAADVIGGKRLISLYPKLTLIVIHSLGRSR